MADVRLSGRMRRPLAGAVERHDFEADIFVPLLFFSRCCNKCTHNKNSSYGFKGFKRRCCGLSTSIVPLTTAQPMEL